MIPVPGIYMIRNCVRQRVYVGSSKNVAVRCKQHVTNLEAGRHPNRALQSDWATDGAAAFEMTLLEPLDNHEARLVAAERRWSERIEKVGLTLYGAYAATRADGVRAVPGLRRARLRVPLTQDELAKRAGVKRLTVSRLEAGGEAYPSTVRQLAAALGCETHVLMEPEPM